MNLNCQVIIVGAGPVGLTMANLLARYGVSTIIFEKKREITYTPRAVSLDDEALRVWQSFGVLESIRPNLYYSEQEDQVLLRYIDDDQRQLFTLRNAPKRFGHPSAVTIFQYEIDLALKDNLAQFAHVHLHFSHTVQSVTNASDHVAVKVRDGFSEKVFKSRYLIACDGEHSVIRSALGLSMRGFRYRHPWLIVDVVENAREEQPVEVLCSSGQALVSIPLPQNRRRFEFLLRGPYKVQELMAHSALLQRIQRFRSFDIKEISKHFLYHFSAKLISRYSLGNVYFAGDAAHLTPPFAGQGLSTGIRDAANLSWKIAAVLKGTYPKIILETYEQERRPHQKKMLFLAVMLGVLMMPVNKVQMVVQNRLLSFLAQFKSVQKFIQIRSESIAPIYRQGFMVKGGMAGQYFPQPVIDDSYFDQELGHWFSVVMLNSRPEDFLSAEELAYWQKVGATFVELPAAQAKFISHYFGGLEKSLFIIRPDRFIYQHLFS